MKKLIEKFYQVQVNSLIKISEKVYRVNADDKNFLFKYHNSNAFEEIFIRLTLLNLTTFVVPLRSKDGLYIESDGNTFFSLSPYYEDEANLAKDIRLHFFIKELAKLHASTSITMNSNDGYFDESLNYLEDEIERTNNEILTRMRRVERESYHSPSDWFFLMNYEHFHKSIEEARRHFRELESLWGETKNLHLSLTYQNFDFRHIIVKHKKIVSLDKMSTSPSIYDLRFLFKEGLTSKYDPTYFIKEYLVIHQLEDYEIHWLLTFLFIPDLTRKNNELDDIKELMKAKAQIAVCEKAAGFFNTILETNK